MGTYVSPYCDRRVFVVGVLGFFCGLPLLLTGSTLAFWLAKDGVSLTKVGLVGVSSLPFTLKFLWSPLVDRVSLPFLTPLLGRRKSWFFLSQVLLAILLYALGQCDPKENLLLVALLAMGISFSAATHLIVLFAYQAERLGRTQYGAGEAMSMFGYRMGILLAGAGALYFATYLHWGTVYEIMALVEAGGLVFLLMIQEPTYHPSKEALWREEKAKDYLHAHPHLRGWKAAILSWSYGAFVCPFADFIQRHKGWVACLILMFVYKLGDSLIGNMTNIFYDHVGFSKQEIANASKIFGMWATIFGGFVGGIVTMRWGMMKSLFYGALFHGMATFCYLMVLNTGHNMPILYLTVALEHITGGMRVTALFAYQLTLCNTAYAATQLALLSSFVEMSRTLFSALSGWLVDHMGWAFFYTLAAFASIPALLVVLYLAGLEQSSLSFWKKVPSQDP